MFTRGLAGSLGAFMFCSSVAASVNLMTKVSIAEPYMPIVERAVVWELETLAIP